MKDLILSARRGVACLVQPRVAVVLFGSGLIWTLANQLAGWLLLGPALVVLFRISLKALRDEVPRFAEDNLAAFEDLRAALVAGILFALPFKLWGVVDDLCNGVRNAQALVSTGIPATASAALFIHFAFHIFAFPEIAERHCGVLEASRRSRELADLPGASGRTQDLGLHVLFTSAVLGVLLLASAWYWRPEAGVVFFVLAGPPAVMMLAAWYLQRTGWPARDAELAVPGGSEDEIAP